MAMFGKLFFVCFILITMTLATGCIQNKVLLPSVAPIPTDTPMVILTPVDNVAGNQGSSSTCEKMDCDIAPTTGYVTCHCSSIPNNFQVIFGTRNNVNGGEHQLIISNDAESDAVAVLTSKGKKDPIFTIFIANQEIHQMVTLSGIKGGSYDLYYILGNSWNSESKKFGSVSSYKRFIDSFDYPTTIKLKSTWTLYIADLTGDESNNPKTTRVEENNFPKLYL